MLRILGGILVVCITLFAKLELECIERDDNFQVLNWQNGLTFLNFLEEQSLPLALYYSLEVEDKELVAEIKANEDYYLLQDENFHLAQALIPINDELQIHLYKDVDRRFKIEIIPIEYETRQETIVLSIKNSPYQDILSATKNSALANEFIQAYKHSIDFRRDLRTDDKLAIIYTQKYRLGKSFAEPTIEAAMIETNRKNNYLFLNADGRYYNEKGTAVAGYFLEVPLNYKRISSTFTLKRYHPVLKRYRAHLGIDYAASTGTHVKSSGDGRVIFKGYKGGYGKTIIVKHSNGYKTLYAHLNGYKSNIRVGSSVKKGQLIAYVGSTGLSTGPHLHFGVYKNEKPINPARAVKEKRLAKLQGQDRDKFMKMANSYKDFIDMQIAGSNLPLHAEIKNPIYIAKLDKNKK